MTETARSLEAPLEARSKSRETWHWMIAGAVLLLLILVVVPPFINISRFRRTILRSVSAGLGRPVEASAVELVLFPRPGFVLHNLTVGEDPAYGAEPVMMAETVTAGLRASTLWHARVEIATLRFDTPSVNLVRNGEGQWNFESLLRNSPALQPRGGLVSLSSSRRLPFPYVEATDARINFKLGPEKLPFSLERADLAVWKESRHQWRLRIKARPIRTDLTVMDAGQIRAEGTLMTGGPLINAPVRASVEWRRVQLGEINRLLHGQDDSWRGTVNWTAQAKGTLADVSVASDIAVEEFRRAEFIPATKMDFSAHCNARYVRSNPLSNSITETNSLACDAPVGDGHLLLHSTGSWPQGTGQPASIQIALHQIPAEFFLDLLGRIHPGISDETTISGVVNGEADCDLHALAAPSACSGEIRSPEVRLHLAHYDRPLVLSSLLLASSPAVPEIWTLSPIHLPLGGAIPVTIAGTMNSTGAALKVTGAADLAQLAHLAEASKIPVLSGEVESIRGGAQLALSFRSAWQAHADAVSQSASPADSVQSMQVAGFAPSHWTGTVQMRNTTLKLAMFPVPLQLTSAHVNLTSTGVEWNILNGSFAHTPFDGRIQWQTPCLNFTAACARTFALHTPNLNAAHLQAAFHNPEGESNLLSLINPWSAGIPRIPEISGTVNADALSAGKLSLKNASLQLQIQGQSAELTSISGKIFGGTVSGVSANTSASGTLNTAATGSMHWGDGAPIYKLRLKLAEIQPNGVGAIWNETWGLGAANVQIDLKTQGWSAAELTQNASGKFRAEWLNGSLSGTSAAFPQPAIENFRRWSGQGIIRDRTLVLSASQLVPQNVRRKNPNTAQSITGTITFARILDLRLEPSGTSVTGSLAMPVATALSGATQ